MWPRENLISWSFMQLRNPEDRQIINSKTTNPWTKVPLWRETHNKIGGSGEIDGHNRPTDENNYGPANMTHSPVDASLQVGREIQ